MTARSTYEASVRAALPTRVLTNLANAVAHQETVNANGSSGFGSSTSRGVTVAQDLAIRGANATYVAAKQAAAMAEQTTIDNAKAVLRNSGDTAPA